VDRFLMPGRDSMPFCIRFRRLAWIAGLAVLALGSCACAFAQEEPGQDPPPPAVGPGSPNETAEPPAPLPLTNVARATVHGVVKNLTTGQPLPRALVRIEGDATAGALTDGDGRFEISGVPVGPQAFQVMKPGFVDAATAPAGMGGPVVNGASNSEHNIYVVADMPEVAFTLAPTDAIQGNVELSTGDPAQSIAVMLLRRAVQDGRVIWQPVTNVRTNSQGAYRFAGLTDGTYALFTEPAMDSDFPVAFVGAGGDEAMTRAGYRSMFYPDATDLAGAAKIAVAGGGQTQANLLLTEEPFHLVRAAITLPHGNVSLNVNVMVLDGQGRQLPYSAQYDQATHSVQAFLPDGSYTLQVTAIIQPPPGAVSFGGPRPAGPTGVNSPGGQLIGRVEFSVAGRSVTHLQIPLTAQHGNTIQVSVIRSGTPQKTANSSFSLSVANGNQQPPIVVMLSQAGGSINDGMVTSFAEGYATGPIETSPDMGPGSYWVHTNIPQKTLCEASFTAGGASLAREPLVLSLTGASAPLTLTLRDDCASLKISLPNEADVEEAGDEPYYTVYVVPDFDSTTDITPVVLRPSSGGSITLDGLTPGSYHVYSFDSQVQLEYRNPEAMTALANHAQSITLDAGMTSSLVVEAPHH
jgi:hypothetical protein